MVHSNIRKSIWQHTEGFIAINIRKQRQCSMVEIEHIVCVCVCVCVCMCVCARAHLFSVLMCPHKHMYMNFYSKTLFVTYIAINVEGYIISESINLSGLGHVTPRSTLS